MRPGRMCRRHGMQVELSLTELLDLPPEEQSAAEWFALQKRSDRSNVRGWGLRRVALRDAAQASCRSLRTLCGATHPPWCARRRKAALLRLRRRHTSVRLFAASQQSRIAGRASHMSVSELAQHTTTLKNAKITETGLYTCAAVLCAAAQRRRLHTEFLRAFEIPSMNFGAGKLHFTVEVGHGKGRTGELPAEAPDGNLVFVQPCAPPHIA